MTLIEIHNWFLRHFDTRCATIGTGRSTFPCAWKYAYFTVLKYTYTVLKTYIITFHFFGDLSFSHGVLTGRYMVCVPTEFHCSISRRCKLTDPRRGLNEIWIANFQAITSVIHDRGISDECHWTLLVMSSLVQVMAWCRQATSHYLRQSWPRSISLSGVTRL